MVHLGATESNARIAPPELTFGAVRLLVWRSVGFGRRWVWNWFEAFIAKELDFHRRSGEDYIFENISQPIRRHREHSRVEDEKPLSNGGVGVP